MKGKFKKVGNLSLIFCGLSLSPRFSWGLLAFCVLHG